MQGRHALAALLGLLACSRDDGATSTAAPPLYGWWRAGAGEMIKITPDEVIRARVAGLWTADVCETALDGKTVTFSCGTAFDRGGPITATLDGGRLALPGLTLVPASSAAAADYEQRAAASLPPADSCARARTCYRIANERLAASRSLTLDADKDLGFSVGRTACAALMKSAVQTLEMQKIAAPAECK